MAENVGFNWNLLPEEMTIDILTRLPTREVCRSKCVSKRLNSMISQPSFIKHYISRANPPWLILDRTIQFTGTESSSKVGGSGSTSTDELAIKLESSPRPGISTLIINPALIAKNRTVLRDTPGKIIGSSNGLVLCCLELKLKNQFFGILVHRDTLLFVSNPVTREWARIPKPPFHSFDMFYTFGAGFTSRVDPENGSLDKFLVVVYQHMEDTNTSMVQCFSSDTGKWVVKEGKYMLPPEENQLGFIPYWGFEFDGRLFWVDYGVGLITWDVDGDIFAEADTDVMAKCRLIPLPTGQERPETTRKMVATRSFGGVIGGRSIQYMEVFEEGDCWFKCWRIEDYRVPVSEWSLLYTLSRVDVPNDLGFGVLDFDNMRILSRHPPYEPDSVVLCAQGTLFSFDFRTKSVQGFGHFIVSALECIPLVLPRWPISIPPRLYAMYAKEEGNVCLREQNYKEAIECYTKSIDLFPSAVSPETYINRAKAYFKVSSFFEAEVDCTQALEIGDSCFIEAEVDCTQALEIGDSCFEGHALRAIVREDLGNNLEGCKEDEAVALMLMPMYVTNNM